MTPAAVPAPPTMPAAGVTPTPAPAVVLTEHETAVLNTVERYLKDGIALKTWYDRAFALDKFEKRFDLARFENRPGKSFGFFDHAEISGNKIEVMGNYQEMFYDQPGSVTQTEPEWKSDWLNQIREFVLHYFMRVSSFSPPTASISSGYPDPSAYLPGLSWSEPQRRQMEGFGFSQLFCKLRSTGEIIRVPEHLEFAIFDLRDIAAKYEWVVLKVRIFDFALRLRPLGAEGPEVVMDLNESSYLVISPEFVVNEDSSSGHLPGGPVARYGFGYAFIRNPERGVAAYGPGEFTAAYESIRFEVAANGSVTVHMDFVSNRPEQATSVDFNPAKWGFEVANAFSLGLISRSLPSLRTALPAFSLGRMDPLSLYITLANALTAGQAGDMMGISRDQLDKRFLLQHFTQHYQTVAGSLMTWRQMPDWLDTASLPKWVITGGLINC